MIVIGVFPELLPVGGIQQISRHTAVLLHQWAERRRIPCQLWSLSDPGGWYEIKVGEACCGVRGFGRNKGRLALALLRAAPKTSLLYLAHRNFAVLELWAGLINPRMRKVVMTYGIEAWQRASIPARLGLRSASMVMTLSRFTGDRVAQVQGVDSFRIRLIPPSLDPAFANGAAEPLPIRCGKTILTVARLASTESFKGTDTVIESMVRVRDAVLDVQYVIVGDGDDRPRLQSLAKERGVADSVLFVGAKSGAELASYYETCDVFAMPSQKEGFGIVYLEAMAFGKPVIGGDAGGAPEAIQHGRTGYLVRYGDVNELSERIIQLLSDSELRRRMGEEGRRMVRERYSFDQYAQQFHRLLEEAAA